MSLEQRLQKFSTKISVHLIEKTPSYHSIYQRLVIKRRVTEFVMCYLLILGGQQLLIQNIFFAPLWPAAGVALSAVFLRGNTMLLSIFMGTLTSLWVFHPPLLPSLFYSGLFTLMIYLIRYCALRYIGAVQPIVQRRILINFIGIISVFCALHITLLQFLGELPWIISFLSEMNGFLCLTPLCLIFTPFVPAEYFHAKLTWWRWALLIIFAHSLFFFLAPGLPSIMLAVGFFFILAFYARIYGQIPTGIALLGISTLYLGGTLPFPHLFSPLSSEWETQILLGIFLATNITSLMIAIKSHKTG